MIKEILVKNGMIDKKNSIYRLGNSASSTDDSELSKDGSTPSSKDDSELSKDGSTLSSNLIVNIVSFIISCFAVYLSWSCNTAIGLPIVLKIIYGFFAFVFGTIYMIYYLLFRGDFCYTQIKSSGSI